MIITLKKRWAMLVAVPYRELLDSPGIGRAHDLQRIVSYGTGVALGLAVHMPPWRTIAVVGIAGVMLILAIRRTITKRAAPPYPLALADELASGTAVAAATASPLITVAVMLFIGLAVTATFQAPRKLALSSTIVLGTPAVVTAAVIGANTSDRVDEYVSALVLIALLLALSTFILGFFSIQARQLRIALGRRETQLSAVLDVTPVVLATVDENGKLETLAGDLRDWSELSGHTVPVESGIARVVETAASGSRVTDDVVLGTRTYRLTCDPGTDGRALLTAFDITEQTDARQRLEDLIRSKDQFIAAVSHELRTPLSAVLGFAEVVRDSMPAADPLQPMIHEVADQSSEMAAIIDDLLVAARSSFEAVPTAPKMVDLAAEAVAVAETIGPRLSGEPSYDLESTRAYADPIRVRQIIRNLLTNADRYGGDEVRIETTEAKNEAVLRVLDNGPELSPALAERIFEAYESSGPVRGQPAAIGLGLTVSRTLAEIMGGSVLYHHDGRWSAFELRLPTKSPVRSSAADPTSKALTPGAVQDRTSVASATST